jgi:hypothetical protein
MLEQNIFEPGIRTEVRIKMIFDIIRSTYTADLRNIFLIAATENAADFRESALSADDQSGRIKTTSVVLSVDFL